MVPVVKRLLMFVARVGELTRWNRLEFWAYDVILAHGWDDIDTFTRLDYEPKTRGDS